MKSLFRRFPVVGGKILKNLDSKSLAQCKVARREISEFLENEKLYFISIIKKYTDKFKGFEKLWNEVIHKTPIKIIKQLAIAVQLCSKNKPYLKRRVSPILIAGDNFELCDYVVSKRKNNKTENAVSVSRQRARLTTLTKEW